MFIGVINQLTSGGHAVCWLVVPQMHVPSEKSMLNSPRCCAAPWNQRDPICSPFELASRKCHQRGWNSISILFGSLSFMIWMFQWAKVHPIITCPGFGRISGGAWELKLKLWLKAWDWRRWMQGIQPLVSDSDGLWVSKKFRLLLTQETTGQTAFHGDPLGSIPDFHDICQFRAFTPLGQGTSFVPSAARSGAHEQPREAPVLAHEPRANQCERFTALNKAVHFKLFWTWHQPTPWAHLGALSNGVFWCDISRGFAAVIVFEMFWSSMNLTSDDWFVSRPSHPDLHENWCKRGKVIPASAKSQHAQKSIYDTMEKPLENPP